MSSLEATTVREVMTRRPVTVSMDATLNTIKQLFDQHRFHHVLVVEGRKLVGVISDRDLLHHLSPFLGNTFNERTQDIATLNKRAHQIMSRKPVTATPETSVKVAAQLILEHQISCLPVVDEDCHPLGIVTWRDLLRTLTPEVG
jgi:acetoin utilization protein AcuB